MTSAELVAPAQQPANGTAIAALIFVILSYVAPIVIVIVGVVAASDYVSNESPLPSVFVGIFTALIVGVVVSIALDFVGIGLGVIALFRKNRGKVLASIALAVAFVPLAASVGVFALFGEWSPNVQ